MLHHLKSIHKHSIVLSRFKVKLITFSMIIFHFSDSNTYNKYSNALVISKVCYLAPFIYREYNLCLKSSKHERTFLKIGPCGFYFSFETNNFQQWSECHSGCHISEDICNFLIRFTRNS